MNATGLNVGSGCAYLYDGATGTQGSICADGNSTTAQFNKNGGASTYYSQTWWSQYSRYTSYYYDYYICGYDYWGYPYYCWYPVYYTNTYYNSGYWTDNSSSQSGAPFFNLDSNVSTTLNITDANGLQFKAGGTFGVTSTPSNSSWNYCNNYSYYYYYQNCYTGSAQGLYKQGSGSGLGD